MNAAVLMLTLCLSAAGGDVSLVIDGRAVHLEPPSVVESRDPKSDGDPRIFVPLEAFADALDLQAKVVVPDKLVVLCHGDWCRPIQLQAEDVRDLKGHTAVEIGRLASALKYEVNVERGSQTDDEGRVLIRLSRNETDGGGQPKKLEAGEILPDVVLTDLNGEPVHLAEFFGRRLLICTWASW